MGFNDKFALRKILNGPCRFWSRLFPNFGRALALSATDAAVLGAPAPGHLFWSWLATLKRHLLFHCNHRPSVFSEDRNHRSIFSGDRNADADIRERGAGK
jgi:hypothetical protein